MRQIAPLLVVATVLAVGSPVFAAETDPVPPSQLTQGITLVGPDATETYGSVGTTWAGVPRERGNVFSVTTPANITMMEWYIDAPVSQTFYFSIYRKTNDGSLTGTYDQVVSVSATISTTGPDWISSGPMSYTLDPAYYYYMSIAWDVESATYYRGTEATPFATGFGQLETGVPAGSGHPTTWTNTYASGAFPPYYQRLTFDIVPVELQSLTVE